MVSGPKDSGASTTRDTEIPARRYLDDHLDFALRNENFNLLLLRRTFAAIDPKVMEAFVKATPKGNTASAGVVSV